MRKFLIILFAALSLLSVLPSAAQDRKMVMGKLLNKTTGKPFGRDSEILIYAFNTVGQAEDAVNIINTNAGTNITTAYDVLPPDESGNFTATLPENGALIIKVDLNPAVLVPVNYRSEIVVTVEGGNILDASRKVESSGNILPLEEDATVEGDRLVAVYRFPVPKGAVRSDNSRLILQPIFMNGLTGDTLAHLVPFVYDGSEYRLTQLRRMGFNPSNDPLSKYVLPDTLTSDGFIVNWRDTITLADPKGRYYVKGHIIVEDYNVVTFSRDSIPLASARQRRPMQFLDYNLDTYDLDPEKYHDKAQPRKMESAGSMSLNFLVNQARIDESDGESMAALNGVRNRLMEIVRGENSRLLMFHIESVSSPDGPYDKNVTLSRQRLQYAENYITSSIPAHYMSRVYRPKFNATVATWSDVADSLERRGHRREAGEVRLIVSRYRNRDDQWRTVKAQKWYKSLVVPVLDDMRTVRYSYEHEEFRPQTPEEILAKYRNDPEYISGKKHFETYEYWELFRLLEEGGAPEDELTALYKRACDETFEERGKSWIYAADKYAVACLKKGIVDTTILAPHIDMSRKANFEMTNMDRTKTIVNPDAVVANQLRMFLMLNKFSRASIVAQMLPDNERFKILKAVTMCLGGYYKGGRTPEEILKRREWFNTVMESTPVNRVVMLLAQNTPGYDNMASKAIDNLSNDDALTWYFRAVVSSRRLKGGNSDWMEPQNFEDALVNCFERDKKFVGLARTDGDINEEELKAFFKNYPEYDKY